MTNAPNKYNASGSTSSDQSNAGSMPPALWVWLLISTLLVGRSVFSGSGILVSVADGIAIFLMPVTLTAWYRHVRPKPSKGLLIGFGLWATFLLLGNAIEGNLYSGLLGQLLPVILIGSAALLFIWIVESTSITTALLTFALIQVVGLIQVHSSNPSVLTQPWKFGLGVAATLAATAVSRHHTWLTIAILLSLAGLSLYLDCRSLGALQLATAGLMLIKPVGAKSKSAAVLIACFSISSLYFATTVYEDFASSGAIGAAARYRYEQQIQSKSSLEILTITRPEVVVASSLALDRPLFGYGTKPQPTGSEIGHALRSLSANGYDPSPREVDRLVGDGITTHSILFDKWLTGGLVAALLGLLAALAVWLSAFRGAWLACAPAAFLLVSFSWDLMSSPLVPGSQWVYGPLVAFACAGGKLIWS